MALFFLAIVAGALTVLAPCVLPVLPFVLGAGIGRSRWRPIAIVAGFVGSFSLIGAGLATAGSVLGIDGGALRNVAVALLAVFGLSMIFSGAYARATARLQPAFAKLGARVSAAARGRGDAASGILVGISLGLVWTPCAGPVLGTILTLAAGGKDYLSTAALMFAYALGSGLPLLGIAYGGAAASARLRRIGRLHGIVEKIFGVLILLAAAGIATGADLKVQTWLIDYYPTWLVGAL